MKPPKVRLAYVLVWRNDARNQTHYYAPHPGHPSVPDFMKLYADPNTVLICFREGSWVPGRWHGYIFARRVRPPG